MTTPPLYLHIGAPKTGTTYLQSLMRSQRDRLRDAGVLVPGPKGNQKAAARAFVRHGDSGRARSGPWEDLVAQVAEWRGPSVISNETFGARLTEGHRARLARDFGDRDLHVVFTVRDLQRQLPAAWQEAVKNGSTLTFAEYFDLISSPESRDGFVKERRLWRAQEARQILAPWGDLVGPQSVHVVTVPLRGAPHDLLWNRFAEVIGVDPTCVDPAAVRPNASLGSAETNVLRRINTLLMSRDDRLGDGEYIRLVKTRIANGVLQFPGRRTPIQLTAEQAEWTARESRRIADELKDLSYQVVGDLDEMAPPPDAGTGYQDPDRPTAEDERDAAIATLTALILKGADRSNVNDADDG